MAKTTRLSGLVMDMRQGEVITLGHNIKIHFLEKSGRITRVRVAAPVEVKIKKESERGEESRHAAQGLPVP
ncbi:MAG: carbon storage regulator [Gammaproteobacteria bacterium]